MRTHAESAPTLEIVERRDEKNVTYFAYDARRHKLYASSEAKAPLSALHSFDFDRFASLNSSFGSVCRLNIFRLIRLDSFLMKSRKILLF